MKRLISIRLSQALASLLVVLAFFVSTAFDIHGNQLQAQAEPVTPEASNYKVERTAERFSNDTQNAANNVASDVQQAGKRAAKETQAKGNNLIDTIREKLNLDEPIDPGTKQAGQQIKDAATGAAKSTQRAVEDTTDSTRRAVRDTTKSAQRTVNDTVD